MFRFLKISIAQLLCLTAIVGSIVFAFADDRSEPFWRDDCLRYEVPEVPRSFQLIETKPIYVGTEARWLTKKYDGASALFLESHWQGWERIRSDIYRDRQWSIEYEPYDFFDEYDFSKLSFRDADELFFLARWEGSQQCRKQIRELLKECDAVELRGRIAYSRNWALVAPMLVLVTALLVLAIYCPFEWKPNV